MILSLRRPTVADLDRIRENPPTYLGTARDRPAGYHVMTRRRAITVPWPQAVAALRAWAPQRHAGARVHPAGPPCPDASVALVLGGCLVIPCRITRVTDEPDHYGFEYVTLLGHPEQGAEAFDLRCVDSGVSFEISAVSRPADLVTWLGGPLARLVQGAITSRYLASIGPGPTMPG